MFKKTALFLLLTLFGLSPAMITLASGTSNYTVTDDGTLTTTGSATGGGFDNGTTAGTAVSGSGATASISLGTTGSGGVFSHGPVPIAFGSAMLRNGDDTEIYVLPGSDPEDVEPSRGFFNYNLITDSWSVLASVPAPVFLGATLIRYANENEIYLLRANNSTDFWKYTITTDTWTALASLPEAAANGASLLRDGSDDGIYALTGAGTTGFYRYSISGNVWTALASTPAAVGYGGMMRRDPGADAIYALQGNGGTGWYRYSVSGNAWTSLAPVPGPVLFGSAVVHDSGTDTYNILEGDFLTGFFRYSVTANAWTPLSDAPYNAYFGSLMLHRTGEDAVYALKGWDEDTDAASKGFYRYSLAANSWTPLTDTPVAAYFGSVMIRNAGDDIYVLPGNKSDALLHYSISGNTWIGSGTYPASGTFTSAVIDLHDAPTSLGSINWTSIMPGATMLSFATRTGGTPTPDGTWSAFSPGLTVTGPITSPAARYLQYRATLGTTDSSKTPVLNDVVIAYSVSSPANPPETTLDSAPVDPTTSTTATFTFHSSQAGSTFECSLDADAFRVCASSAIYTGLTPGLHYFRVRAKNADGELDASPSSYAWSVVPASQDQDGDTVIDSEDDCPTSAGTPEFNGCDAKADISASGMPHGKGGKGAAEKIGGASIRLFDRSGGCAKAGGSPAQMAKIYQTCPSATEAVTDADGNASFGIRSGNAWLIIGFDPGTGAYAKRDLDASSGRNVTVSLQFKS